MRRWMAALGLAVSAGAASAQLVDQGFVGGWNIMMDPEMGNGCLIQTVYEDRSVVRIGYDRLNDRGYIVTFNKGWGDIREGETYPITFDLDGERFDAVATGFRLDRVPGAGVFFDDPAFVTALGAREVLRVFNASGAEVMAVSLKGSAKAIDYARQCQARQG